MTLVYADSFDAGSPETRFTREITPKGSSEYKVNKKKVTKENYEAALSDINVLVKARNFLVFQGDVEGIARKTPKQLVDMLENISGSSDFKEEVRRHVMVYAAFANPSNPDPPPSFPLRSTK